MDAPNNPIKDLLQLMSGFWATQCVYVAAKLDLADHIKGGVHNVDELAGLTHTHAPSLHRLLRGLASLGVFTEKREGYFHMTPMAECLVEATVSQKPVALMMGEEHYLCWSELLYSVRTGGTAFEKLYKKLPFDFLAEHPDKARIFDAAMQGIHGMETPAMLDAYDFSGFGTLVDIGGGNGSLLCSTLKRHPNLRGLLYDLPNVIERAKISIAREGLSGRCQVQGGSFFDAVPAGGDAYMMRHIIHDWPDEQCVKILRNCRKVMKPGNKLLLIEGVIAPGNEPSFTKLLDLNMLVLPGGKERTEAEYRYLYGAAGFRLNRVVPTKTEICVIEGEVG